MSRKSKQQARLNQAMWRGAKWGGAILGSLGFTTGITVCIAYHLPFPPIAVTEIGVLCGGCMGALAGYASCFPAGRTALKGLVAGSLLGLPVAALMPGPAPILAWFGCLVMSTVVGYQAGSDRTAPTSEDWQLHQT